MTGIASGNNAVSQPDDAGLAGTAIQIVNPLAVPGWDEEIRQIPGNSFFHGTSWLRVLQDAYGFEPVCLVARQGPERRITGLLVLVEVKSWLTAKRGVGLPFADFCPMLAADEGTADALWQKALELGRERHWKTLEIRGLQTTENTKNTESLTTNQHESTREDPTGEGPAKDANNTKDLTGENRYNRERDLTTNQHELTRKDSTGELPAPSSLLPAPSSPLTGRAPAPQLPPLSPVKLSFAAPSLQFYEHVLDLTPGADIIFKNLEGSNRRAIRKAEASGLTVKITDTLEAMQVFHQLYCLTRQKHGLPPQPFKFFAAIHKHIIAKGLGLIFQANLAQQTVASAIFFTAGNEASYKYGASDHRHQELRANNLVMWAAIKSLIDKGFKTVHFGRTSLDNDGLRRFKKSWNSAENLLSYYCYNFRQSQLVKQNDQAQGWHNRVFRCLPITLAQVVGAALYRHTA